ncbi:dicarboxylate/amino acid:cation symporter [Natroniella sulfidigena]|uniref:dicarboxylate/amino acid:cation symporter n=1 Tax=Natroniella sulfidigena TaxID=723921 RepID=UPI00200AA7D9|nr:dicarboxylate/amino acid:cation symporter [Natroniella sulfidigena]MCK8817549.1 dicarboxylate/amino acid:cation symporter [Natroniella sulfidigena]
MQKLGLLPKLLLGIVFGIIVGLFFPNWFARAFYTITNVFGEFLMYIVPLIILGFIVPGIAELGDKAGKLLGITVGTAYLSTVIAGVIAYFIGDAILPSIIADGAVQSAENGGIEPFLAIEMPPLMGVMTALITSFLLGLGISQIKDEQNVILDFMYDFRKIIVLAIEKVIIPFLPLYIAGVFADMAATGEVFETLGVFGQVFALVIALHLGYLVVLFLVAGQRSGSNPFKSLKNMVPAYTTALGTMSSAATLPVTLKNAKKNEVSEEVADFAIPLSATIHLAGSTITLVLCALTVLLLHGGQPALAEFLPFIMSLGVVMVAAPGVPGGAVMAAMGLMTTILGFSEPQQALMIGLYMAQDGFGTACNVTGDGAIAMIVDSISNKFSKTA